MGELVNHAKLENEVENVTPSKEKREGNFRISKADNLAGVYSVVESKTAIIPPIKPHLEKVITTVEVIYCDYYVTFMENLVRIQKRIKYATSS